MIEPLKTDIELQEPKDIEEAMSLARAYERRAHVMVEAGQHSTTSKFATRPSSRSTSSMVRARGTTMTEA